MFCNLCGANIPDGSPQCSKCKNFFPRNLGSYSYKAVLTSFADYNAKKETAKYLAAHTPSASLSEIIKKLDSVPLIVAKEVDAAKARELEQTFARLRARLRFVPVFRSEEEKQRLIADLRKPLKHSYVENRELPIPKSVERLETEPKKSVVSARFILIAVSILLLAVIFGVLPQYYKRFYEEQKRERLAPLNPTPESVVPSPKKTGDVEAPPEAAKRKIPVIVPEIIPKPQDPTAQEGISLYQRGLYAEALKKFLSALTKDPQDETLKKNVAASYLALGLEQINKENFEDAQSYITASLKYSEEYEAYEGLGYIAEKKSDYASAEKYYKKVLQLNPGADEAMLSLGVVYYYQERLDESLTLLSKFSAKYPTNETAKYYIGKIQRENPVESDLVTRETGHFIVKYAGSSKNLVADFILPMLEDAYATVGAKLGYYPDHKITVILYTDRRIYGRNRPARLGGGGLRRKDQDTDQGDLPVDRRSQENDPP